MNYEIVSYPNEMFGGEDYKLRVTRSDDEKFIVYTFESYQYPTMTEINDAIQYVTENHPHWLFTPDEIKEKTTQFYQMKYNQLQDEISKLLETASSLGIEIEVS